MARTVDLRLLEYFVAIAEQRNITRAAHRLGIAQPALSQQIRDLEHRLGARLLDRQSSGVSLTPAGQALLEGAREMLSTSAALANHVRQAARGRNRLVRIGLTTSASLHPGSSELLRRVASRREDVFTELHDGNAQTLTEQLIDRRLDVIILRSQVMARASLQAIVLDEEPILVALPRSHRLCRARSTTRRAPIALQTLQDENLLLVRRPGQPGIYQQVIEACLSAGFAPRIIAEVARMIPCLNMVAAGMGISAIPASVRSLMPGHVVSIPCTELLGMKVPLTMLYRRSNDAPVVEDFVAEAAAMQAARVHAFATQSTPRPARRNRCARPPRT